MSQNNMARFYCLTLFLVLSSPALMHFSDSSLSKVVPQTHKPTGVFMLIDGGKYTLNFSDARAACLFLNVTMATRHQMERAVQHGLETCKFGWLAEQIAVIPRVKPEKNCGSGKTGVVTWSVSPDKQFGVFCFNDSDQDETVKTSAAGPLSSTTTSSQVVLTRSSSPLTPSVTSTGSPPSTDVTTHPEESDSDSTPLMETTRTSSSPSPKTDSPHHLITSKQAEDSLEFLTSPQAAKPSLGAGPTALLSVGLVLLVLIAAGVGWYCRLRPFSWHGRLLNDDDTETEMWKKTDLYCEPEADEDEDEEVDKTYSSNITLCVDPCFKANSRLADVSVEV